MNEDSITPVVVTKLLESHRRPGRYVVSLSDNRVFTVNAPLLSTLGLTRSGAALLPGQLARLESESVVIDLMDRALDAMARSRRSRRELELRLRKREPRQELVREALDRLVASGLLSDHEVARAEASARLRRGEAVAQVRRRLMAKGIDTGVISEALSSALEDAKAEGYDEISACRDLAVRRIKALGSLPAEVAARRLTAFLARRGFAASLVREAVSEVISAEFPDEPPDQFSDEFPDERRVSEDGEV